MDEKTFLANYSIENFDRPSVATDIAIFSVDKDDEENIRRNQKGKLQLLLIRRESHPFKDFWALPGGFCRKGEEVFQTAKRELKEETGIDSAHLSISDICGHPGRDPRGWIISQSYLALLDKQKVSLRAGTDAWDAKWFDICISSNVTSTKKDVDSLTLNVQWTLELKHEDIILKSTIEETRSFEDFHKKSEYLLLSSDGLGFDHGIIILKAFLNLQNKVKHDDKMIFDLMPEKFTLAELQDIYEAVIGSSVLTPNFRRKMAPYVEETTDVAPNRAHRQAKLYRRNIETFYDEL